MDGVSWEAAERNPLELSPWLFCLNGVDSEDGHVSRASRPLAAGVFVGFRVEHKLSFNGYGSGREIGRLSGEHFHKNAVVKRRAGTETTLFVVTDEHKLRKPFVLVGAAGQDVPT